MIRAVIAAKPRIVKAINAADALAETCVIVTVYSIVAIAIFGALIMGSF